MASGGNVSDSTRCDASYYSFLHRTKEVNLSTVLTFLALSARGAAFSETTSAAFSPVSMPDRAASDTTRFTLAAASLTDSVMVLKATGDETKVLRAATTGAAEVRRVRRAYMAIEGRMWIEFRWCELKGDVREGVK